MMATEVQVPPLIDLQSEAFAEEYERGIWWSLHRIEQGKGPAPDSYLVTNLKTFVAHKEAVQKNPDVFSGKDDDLLYWIVGCLLGELSTRVFPQTLQERKAWEKAHRVLEAALEREQQDQKRHTEAVPLTTSV